MEAVGSASESGEDGSVGAVSSDGAAGASAAGSSSGGAGSSRRRGRRRVVAPPTSGQSHEVEANFTDPFAVSPDASDSEAAPGGAGSVAGPGPRRAASSGEASKAEKKPALSEYEQWILSQRPPHWG